MRKALSPTLIISFGFIAIILIGALLLMTPMASRDGIGAKPLDALFTATSATCVTGLVSVDTGSFYSTFGQCVILFLIQIGGLGFMSMAVLLSIIVRRTISPKERVLIAESYGLDTGAGTVRLMRKILRGTFLFEGTGALLLTLRFIFAYGNGIKEALYKGVFLSVSAFCNAGFDPLGTKESPFCSIVQFAGDATVIITLSLLIIIGGIGFVVWDDILSAVRTKKRLGVYSKFILLLTLFLLVSGAVVFTAYEWDNPDTLGNFNTSGKILNAFFHSVTLRTAGFNTLDTAAFHEGSTFLSIIYMLIGGASGSTAGGLKVGTVGVIIATAVCGAAGRTRVSIFKRKIAKDVILRALSVTVIGLILVFTAGLVINAADGVPVLQAMYESASAYATVGISMCGTPTLGTVSHILLMMLMYFGRVGILTVTFAITVKMRDDSLIDYPNVNIPIG